MFNVLQGTEICVHVGIIGCTYSGGSRKNIWGPGPSSFGTQRRLSEITIEPIENLGAWARFGGLCPLSPT